MAAGCAAQKHPVAETTLTGGAENPPADKDGSGTAQVVLYPEQGRVCFGITVKNIRVPATAAHIHQGAPKVNGRIVVALTPPGIDENSAGCVTGVSRNLIEAIISNPGAYYVNVHNKVFPNGAVRGQLH